MKTFGIREGDGEPELIAKVEQGMRAMGGLEAETSYVRYLFSADPGDPAVAAMDASARRKRLFDALRALMLRGATLRPLVLVFEDLHWIDTSTREYLDFAMDSVAGARVMVILTHRLGQMHPFPGRSFHTTLNLHHLSGAQALEMATRVLGTTEFPEELKIALEEKAEGVPLFVEEMTKSLVDLGFLERENGHYRVTKALEDLSVPDTMQGIIMARLDRLGGDGKRMVQLASVIGRQFVVRLLERVAGLTGKLEGLLGELKALEIIYEQGLLAEPGYIFKHAVIQDVAYSSLLVQSRKDLHRAVGEAIEELYRDRLTEHFGELAHHFARGEDWAKAMQYSTLAGDQAAHVFANAEAKKHYFSALDAAAKLSPSPDWEALLTLHSKYAEVMLNLSEYDDAAAEYLKAVELARRAGDRRREMEALVWLSAAYDFRIAASRRSTISSRHSRSHGNLTTASIRRFASPAGSRSGQLGGVSSSRRPPMLKKLFVCPKRSRTSRCSPGRWCTWAEHYSGVASLTEAWPISRKEPSWHRRFTRASTMASASS